MQKETGIYPSRKSLKDRTPQALCDENEAVLVNALCPMIENFPVDPETAHMVTMSLGGLGKRSHGRLISQDHRTVKDRDRADIKSFERAEGSQEIVVCDICL
jgi:hypothetical protein